MSNQGAVTAHGSTASGTSPRQRRIDDVRHGRDAQPPPRSSQDATARRLRNKTIDVSKSGDQGSKIRAAEPAFMRVVGELQGRLSTWWLAERPARGFRTALWLDRAPERAVSP
jgi:hypothetical protein